MKPRYSTILAGRNLLLSGSITKQSFSKKFIVSTTVRRHSSNLWSLAIMLSMYIVTVYHCILSIANGNFVSFVNFRGLGDKPLGKTTNFESFELQRNLRKVCCHRQCLLSSSHLSSQYLPFNNLAEWRLKLSEVFVF